jgi:hypothetical protein
MSAKGERLFFHGLHQAITKGFSHTPPYREQKNQNYGIGRQE